MRTKGWAVGAVTAAAVGAVAALAGRRRPAGFPEARNSAADPGPAPSPDTDPFGALDAARDRLRRRADDRGPKG
jgi:hypothetical protein